MAEQEAKKIIKKAMEMVKDQDIVHKGFLKPIQIALKTHKTEMLDEDTNLKPESLAGGLKIAVSVSAESQRRVLQNVEEVDGEGECSFDDLREKSQDNLLSLMKRGRDTQQKFQLAICVCMYSETKQMLKSTLAGVAENIANLVAYEGMDPDDIGVFVMMDGIEKVDPSILDYFDECQKSSNIYLGSNITPSLSPEQFQARHRNMSQEQIAQEEMKNVNDFIFNAAQIDERNTMRFESIRSEYFDILEEKKKIREYFQKKNVIFGHLTDRMKQFFLEEARKERKRETGMSDEDVKNLKQENFADYIDDFRKSRPLIAKAIQETNRFCNKYLEAKQDLAYLAYFRNKIDFDIQTLSLMYPAVWSDANESRELLNQESENQYNFAKTTMNLFLCTKYKNAGKLSSHNWFFNGFCKELRPEYAVLLDVGLRPEGTAILKMYKHMKNNRNIGGVCGYMSLKMEKLDENEELKDDQIDFLTKVANIFFDIQRTQQVEYHFAHLMDKSFEASFGFIHVLPGAFSAYNMKAIRDYDDNSDDTLLQSYFKSIQDKLSSRKTVYQKINVSNALLRTMFPDFLNQCCINIRQDSDEAMLYNENVYLAEDRILCMGIHKKKYDLAFLPDAYSEVDPMKTVHGLLGQRKRWINGSYFAFEKVKRELSDHERRERNCELWLNVQILYLTLMNALSYFAPAFFIFTVHIAMQAFRQDVLSVYFNFSVQVLDFFVFTMDFIHVLLIGSVVFLSINFKNNSQYFKPMIYVASTLFGIFMLIVMGVLLTDVIRGLIQGSTYLNQTIPADQVNNTIDPFLVDLLRWLLIGSLGLYLVPLTIYWLLFCTVKPFCEVIGGFLSFLFYTPTYLIILNIYSLCKIDDISWGTKGLDSKPKQNITLINSWKLVKLMHVAKYVIWNTIVASVLLTLGGNYITRFWVTFGLVCIIVFTLFFKVFIGIFYMLYYKCKGPSMKPDVSTPQKQSRIDKIIKNYEPSIRQEIEDYLNQIKREYINKRGASFIQISRSNKSIINQAISKQKKQQEKKSQLWDQVSYFSKSKRLSKKNEGGKGIAPKARGGNKKDDHKRSQANIFVIAQDPELNNAGRIDTGQALMADERLDNNNQGFRKTESKHIDKDKFKMKKPGQK